MVTNRSGSWQAWTTTDTGGTWRQVTDEPVGVETRARRAGRSRRVVAAIRPATRRGRWVAAPFDGGEAAPVGRRGPDGLGHGHLDGRGGRAPSALAAPTTTTGCTWSPMAPAPARLYRARAPRGVGAEWPEGLGGLSADGSLVCIRHARTATSCTMRCGCSTCRPATVVGDLADAGSTRSTPSRGRPFPDDHRLRSRRRARRVRTAGLWDLGLGRTARPRTRSTFPARSSPSPGSPTVERCWFVTNTRARRNSSGSTSTDETHVIVAEPRGDDRRRRGPTRRVGLAQDQRRRRTRRRSSTPDGRSC